MPRRAPLVEPDIPLFLIPHVVRKGILKFREDVVRIVVRKVNRHRYNVSVHSRSIKRELRPPVPRAGYRELPPGYERSTA
jgi:hypothetical protein